MDLKSIVFFYPSRITGGTEYLFVRCSKYLIENSDYKIYYVDYTDGFSHSELNSSRIEFIKYEDGQKVTLPPNSVTICQLNIISQKDKIFSYSPDLNGFLFWGLHFLNIKLQIFRGGHFTITNRKRKQLGDLLDELAQRNIVKFMGLGGYVKITEDLFREPKMYSWLPNIAPLAKNLPTPPFSLLSEYCIKFCWLGRLDEEKSLNVLSYMNDLEVLSNNYNISLSLIGNGPSMDNLKKMSCMYSFPIEFVGELRNKELHDYIIHNSDIGLASGTSTLEFSMRGKPVIEKYLLDHVCIANEIKDYYLTYEAPTYKILSNNKIVRPNEGTFSDKFQQIIINYEEESKRCYDYVLSMSPKRCCDELIKCAKYIANENCENSHILMAKVSKILNKGKCRAELLTKIKRLFIRK